MIFEQQYLNRVWQDDVYDWYFERWIEYYRRTEQFDRSLTPSGRPTGDTWGRMNRHAKTVRKEIFVNYPPFKPDPDKERSAKSEALRQVDREFKKSDE